MTADQNTVAIPTPAVVRPEEVTEEMLQAAVRATKNKEAFNQFWEHDSFEITGDDLRRLIAWAMTHRPPVSDAAVEAALNALHGSGQFDDEHRTDMRSALEAAERV